jgi:Uma2 family endonuclease
MATVPASLRPRRLKSVPLLKNGERLDQKNFHAHYEASPPGFRAELIGGIVYVSSPLKPRHGRYDHHVNHWLGEYSVETPATEVLTNTTDILGPKSEPQPDVCLVILPEFKGQTREDNHGYLTGPPELVVQISDATERLDLGARKDDYEKAGVREYLVVALRRQEVLWFIRRRGKFRELTAGPDGILRSETFPGLWLDPAALLRREVKRLLAVLRLGLASPEHAAFVQRMHK